MTADVDRVYLPVTTGAESAAPLHPGRRAWHPGEDGALRGNQPPPPHGAVLVVRHTERNVRGEWDSVIEARERGKLDGTQVTET